VWGPAVGFRLSLSVALQPRGLVGSTNTTNHTHGEQNVGRLRDSVTPPRGLGLPVVYRDSDVQIRHGVERECSPVLSLRLTPSSRRAVLLTATTYEVWRRLFVVLGQFRPRNVTTAVATCVRRRAGGPADVVRDVPTPESGKGVTLATGLRIQIDATGCVNVSEQGKIKLLCVLTNKSEGSLPAPMLGPMSQRRGNV
jgi:hypothetical protein